MNTSASYGNSRLVWTSFLISALALSGCNSGGNAVDQTLGSSQSTQVSYALSPAEEQLRREHNAKRVGSAAVKGCVSAAIGTALVTVISGGGSRQMARNAAIACAVGAVVGAAAGSYVNARANKSANQQAYYRSLVLGAEQDLNRYRGLNETTRALIADQRTKVADLNSKIAAGQISREEYKEELRAGEGNLQILKRNIKEADGNIQTIDKDMKTLPQNGVYDVSELEERKVALIAEKATLEALVNDLSNVYADAPEDVRPAIS